MTDRSTTNGSTSAPEEPLLLVEDNPGDARLVWEMLKGSSRASSIVHVTTMHDAVSHLVAGRASCALVDLILPDSSGIDTVQQLRAIAPELPIVVLTGMDDEELGVKAVQMGAQDYVPKSNARSDLLTRTILYAQERKRLETELARQAVHDALTGLPNRSLLQDRLAQALARSERQETLVAVMYLDLDRFKAINDGLGHEAGDELLKMVGHRLRRVLRPSDVVARLGGDEFVALCEDLNDERDAAMIADRIVEVMAAPFQICGQDVFTTTSVGIAVTSSSANTPETLLRDADAAMYRAKEWGKNRYELFDQDMRSRIEARMSMEAALQQAVNRDELRLFYQPVIDLRSEHLVSLEALLRWDHPKRGLVFPGEFIPIAEETGAIVPIGRWVLDEACMNLRALQAAHRVDDALKVSVNLSAVQLAHADSPTDVGRALRRSGLDAGNLSIEIAESAVMEPKTAAQTLGELRALGVDLIVDDFGSGYSSLVHLKRFPINTLKVHRSLVRGLGRDEDDSAVVEAAIGMAHTLGLQTVAKGVETPEQLMKLRALRADFAQGYYFGKPQPLENLLSGSDPTASHPEAHAPQI